MPKTGTTERSNILANLKPCSMFSPAPPFLKWYPPSRVPPHSRAYSEVSQTPWVLQQPLKGLGPAGHRLLLSGEGAAGATGEAVDAERAASALTLGLGTCCAGQFCREMDKLGRAFSLLSLWLNPPCRQASTLQV